MQGLLAFFHALRDILSGISGLLTGRRCRFEQAVAIDAPCDVVWRMLRSRDITFDGMMPMHVVVETVPGRPDLEKGRIIVGPREMVLMMRIVDERAGKALLVEILSDGSDPAVVMGRDDFISYIVEETPGGTLLNLTRELVPTRVSAILSVPLGLISGGRRYKRKAEAMAKGVPEAGAPDAGRVVGTGEPADPGSALSASSLGLSRNGITLGLVALASFALLWGWQEALLIAGIIILHELGHASAMLLVGIPVKGIYLVPFFGGAAVAAAPYRREGQIGFVALMGPALSLLPTAVFLLAAQYGGGAGMVRAAELSAIINLLNLAPILPLDGGHVLKSALVSVNRTLARAVGLAGVGFGFWGAWLLRDPLLALFVGIGLLITLQMKTATSRTPMRWPAAFGLLLALFATIAAYACILYLVYKQPRVVY